MGSGWPSDGDTIGRPRLSGGYCQPAEMSPHLSAMPRLHRNDWRESWRPALDHQHGRRVSEGALIPTGAGWNEMI